MAVYTKVSESEVGAFLRDYDLGALQNLTGIRQGVENTNYFVTTDKNRYVLTLYEKRVREEDLPFFLGLMEHLAKKNLPCPSPVKAKDGVALKRLADRPAALTSFLAGRATTRITPDECAEVGRALAAMHLAVGDFKMERPNSLSVKDWPALFAKSKARADEVFTGLADLIQNELDFLTANWPKTLPQGIIHADLFPDNVFFDGPKLCGVIDFYFACKDLFAYEIAICLNAWCFEASAAFNITKAKALLRGYQEVRPFSAEEKKALPLLARGAAMRFLLTRLYDWLNQVPGADVKPKDPLEYLTRLQFHQMVKDVSAYGLSV
ncbi:MAG TPA: homoserine kinase [Alphaproteobacteria bacterium]|nr:homoserine kinase [Alphaproteobacteria bacterium]